MKILNNGDKVVETAGTMTDVSGSTDLIKVGIVGSQNKNDSPFL